MGNPRLIVALAAVVTACTAVEVDLGNRACDTDGRCLEGWECEPATGLCLPAQVGCSDEVCDGFDNDCDGGIDEDLPTHTAYVDVDDDGHGELGAMSYDVCLTLPLFATVADDCDDTDPTRYPGAPDSLGDGIDQDCDGVDGIFVPDPCVPNPCLNGGTCVDTGSGTSCNCAMGYTGGACATNIDDCSPNPCLNGGTCTDGIASFSCACPASYGGPTCACEAGPGVLILPAGSDPCPLGATEPPPLHTSPMAGAGACSCDACMPTVDPSCAGPNLVLTYGTNTACGGGPLSYNVSDNTCTDFGVGPFTVTFYHRWTARMPTAGACTAATLTDVGQVSTTTVRQCLPSDADVACAAEGAGMRLCIPQTGGMCSGKFSVPIAVGDGPDLTCGACGCSRTASTCTIDYHGDSNCTSLGWTTVADGVCTSTNRAPGIEYFEIYPTGVTCDATAGSPTVGLTNPTTICCVP